MNRPYKYTIICNKNGEIIKETNDKPLLRDIQTWEQTEDPNIRILKTTRTVYKDVRYKAKLRLYNYIMYKKNGLEIPKYRPYEYTKYGKSKPILSF